MEAAAAVRERGFMSILLGDPAETVEETAETLRAATMPRYGYVRTKQAEPINRQSAAGQRVYYTRDGCTAECERDERVAYVRVDMEGYLHEQAILVPGDAI